MCCANLTTALGVLKPPVDGKMILIFLNSLEIKGFCGLSPRYLDWRAKLCECLGDCCSDEDKQVARFNIHELNWQQSRKQWMQQCFLGTNTKSPSEMNRHYSLSMWTPLTDGPTNSVVLEMLVTAQKQFSDCIQGDTRTKSLRRTEQSCTQLNNVWPGLVEITTSANSVHYHWDRHTSTKGLTADNVGTFW